MIPIRDDLKPRARGTRGGVNRAHVHGESHATKVYWVGCELERVNGEGELSCVLSTAGEYKYDKPVPIETQIPRSGHFSFGGKRKGGPAQMPTRLLYDSYDLQVALILD
jgi:hypothetical protein